MSECQFFNPMYLQTKCSKCGKYVGTICGNSIHRLECLCESCHIQPSLFARMGLWMRKKLP